MPSPPTHQWLATGRRLHYDKTTTNPGVFKRKFFELRSEFSHHVEIYTDGSKDGIRTAAIVVAPNCVKTVCLPDNASIFTAKIHALDMAVDIIRHTISKDCGFSRPFCLADKQLRAAKSKIHWS